MNLNIQGETGANVAQQRQVLDLSVGILIKFEEQYRSHCPALLIKRKSNLPYTQSLKLWAVRSPASASAAVRT